jgi:glycosyltransferase involved in cell wall biosynthesis
MKILFIIPTYKPAYYYGGTTVVVSLLAESLAAQGNEVTVYTTTANGKKELDVPMAQEVKLNGVSVYYFKRLTKDHTHIAPGFWMRIARTVDQFDQVHLHSWWSPSIVLAAAICKWKGVKPVLSPHGMFCDYVLGSGRKRSKKWIQVLGRSLLKNSFLHVSTKMEWKESQRLLGQNWPGAIIPNLVILPEEQAEGLKPANEIFTIGFLSRIDPKKGVDLLIRALATVSFPYQLKIAGTGDDSYVRYLKQLSVECGNEECIEWVGWKGSQEKFSFFSSLDLFALTSRNENFAVVVVEALSVGTPVFLSDQVGLGAYVMDNKLGWTSSIEDLGQIREQLEKIYQAKQDRHQIALVAPGLIRKDFDPVSLCRQYKAFYQTIKSIQKTELPEAGKKQSDRENTVHKKRLMPKVQP